MHAHITFSVKSILFIFFPSVVSIFERKSPQNAIAADVHWLFHFSQKKIIKRSFLFLLYCVNTFIPFFIVNPKKLHSKIYHVPLHKGRVHVCTYEKILYAQLFKSKCSMNLFVCWSLQIVLENLVQLTLLFCYERKIIICFCVVKIANWQRSSPF